MSNKRLSIDASVNVEGRSSAVETVKNSELGEIKESEFDIQSLEEVHPFL